MTLTPEQMRIAAHSLIDQERDRQEGFVASGKFKQTCASPAMSDAEKLAVLVEEVGEVANEINEAAIHEPSHFNRPAIFLELIQVAAVAVAWMESLGPEHYPKNPTSRASYDETPTHTHLLRSIDALKGDTESALDDIRRDVAARLKVHRQHLHDAEGVAYVPGLEPKQS